MSRLVQSLSEVIPDHLIKGVSEELRRGWMKAEADAHIQAKQIGRHGHANAARSLEGVGQLRLRVPPLAFHYWGQRLGYECWEDEQFVREFIRDNPEVAVRNYSKKTVVNGAIFTADGYVVK